MRKLHPPLVLRLTLALALALPLAACGGAGTDVSPGPDTIKIVVGFYPLQYVSETVGGSAVTVTNLSVPGAEPHDLELSPAQVTEIADADLVLYLKGFQPAVDEAVAQQAADHAIDLSAGIAQLTANQDVGNPDGGVDPHIWLDPKNMATFAEAVTTRLAALDPTASSVFTANKDALTADMSGLTNEFSAGLRNCKSRTLVTSHEAFAYLANAFGLTQVGISGLSPDAEPSPARLAEVADLVSAQGITTIYYETLISPKVAETLAAETGAKAAVLDPLEGLTPGSTESYPDVMRGNLAALISGQGCA